MHTVRRVLRCLPAERKADSGRNGDCERFARLRAPPVYASVAPSFTAYFNGIGIASIRAGLKQLGFADAEETAIGATFVKREYERISREGVQSVVITSCCPTVNTLIEKYYPEITECLAPV